MHTLCKIAALCTLPFLATGTASAQVATTPLPVIFDTDIGNDIDDVLALSMLYTYQKAGKIDLKAITVSKAHPYAVSFTDLMNRYYKLGNIPIGYVGANGATRDSGQYAGQALQFREHGKPIFTYDLALATKVPEAYQLQRKVLAEAKDGSVVLIVVGFSTNIARLLESGADQYSSLTGKALVAKKVKALYMMAGMFGANPFAEYNVAEDIAAARTVFGQWPGTLVTSGYEVGARIQFPAKELIHSFPQLWDHPMVNAYFQYIKMPYDRETWDLTSVLYAVEGAKKYFRESAPGVVTITADGKSTFQEQAGGKHRILILDENKITPIINRFVQTVGGHY
jgi:inosine-uridine nucleoside N-ribohydrolase